MKDAKDLARTEDLVNFRRTAETQRVARRSAEGWWSLARLLSFVAVVTLWYPLRHEGIWPWLCPIACLAVFVWTVRCHLKAKQARLFAQRQVLMCDEAAPRFNGELQVVRSAKPPPAVDDLLKHLPSQMAEEPYWELSLQERDDLDVFTEPIGLFALLNRSSTAIGAARLARWLTRPCMASTTVRQRQAAVRWLAEDLPARQRIMAACTGLRGADSRIQRLTAALVAAGPLPRSAALITGLRVWSLISLLSLLASGVVIMMGHYAWGAPAGVILLINSVVYLGIQSDLNAAIQPWRALRSVAEACQHATEILALELVDVESLSAVQARADEVAHAAWPRLARRLGWTDHGGMFHIMFNFMFFFDVHVAQSLCAVVVPHHRALLDSMAAVADIEALCGLACFAAEQERTCWPEVVEDTHIVIEGGCHPLIPPAEVKPNSASLGAPAGTWIVTGSNMGGKSTFLRMVGSSTVLAQVGTVALAERMQWRPVRLMTDLRIRDDVSRHESYFLAEVRQLRRMLVDVDYDHPILGLIDEPLRGTNSEERVAASMAMVRHLCAVPHLFIVATHERGLTDLADGRTAENYHFEEHLVEEGKTFDHTLRPGPAQERNALRVMEREGFPASLIEDARAQIVHSMRS